MTGQQLHIEALTHLRQARDRMARLLSVSSDWTRRVQFETEFDLLERDIIEYGRCQLFLEPDQQ